MDMMLSEDMGRRTALALISRNQQAGRTGSCIPKRIRPLPSHGTNKAQSTCSLSEHATHFAKWITQLRTVFMLSSRLHHLPQARPGPY